jgi:uncharacterized membrane protein
MTKAFLLFLFSRRVQKNVMLFLVQLARDVPQIRGERSGDRRERGMAGFVRRERRARGRIDDVRDDREGARRKVFLVRFR